MNELIGNSRTQAKRSLASMLRVLVPYLPPKIVLPDDAPEEWEPFEASAPDPSPISDRGALRDRESL